MDLVFRKRAPLVLVCAAAVAISTRLNAAGVPSQDVPVPGGTAGLAHRLGIDPVPDRGRFIAEVTRLVFDLEGRNPSTAAFLQSLRLKTQAAGSKTRRQQRTPANPDREDLPPSFELVPVPLSADVWSDAIFHRRVPVDELVTAIIADRPATLICRGLTALDDETLEFFAGHGSLLFRLYERSAPAFAVFSSALRIHGNRIIPPGADALPAGHDRDAIGVLWEAVIGEKLTKPDRFVIALFEASEGRLAYLYDLAAHLDPARRAFVLGLWIDDAGKRIDRFRALATAGLGAFKDWHLRTMPYGRAAWDLAMSVTRLEVAPNGAPRSPAARAFWTRTFANTDAADEALVARDFEDAPFDAAWLAEVLGEVDPRQRVERLDQIALAQRRFGRVGVEHAGAVFVALHALSQARMLMLTLDRIGVAAPAVYAAAARHAQRLATLSGGRGFVAQAQFQGSIAIVGRMAAVRTITPGQAEYLIARLARTPISDDGRYAGGILRWLHDDVGPAIAGVVPSGNTDAALVAAVSGQPSSDGTSPRIAWEGQRYRLDLGFAERHRLERVRERQEALPVDIAVQLGAVGRRLGSENVPADEIDETSGQLSAIIERIPKRSKGDLQFSGPAGMPAPLDPHEIVRKAIEELGKAARAKDTRRERIAETIVDLADELLAQALLSFVYAINIGDPDGSALLAGDVSYRHDFGFGVKDGPLRSRATWALGRQEVAPGVPWHVSGSLLGLDLALAPLALRRINFEHLTGAPRLTSNERDAFAASVALLNPYALKDQDRDTIVEAVDRGRARVRALENDPSGLDAIADAIGVDGRRRRELRWTIAHEPAVVRTMFSMTELLQLGGADLAALDPWGMIGLASTGSISSRLDPPGRWWLMAGRPQLGIVATGLPDLHLHVAAKLKELQIPAALARVVLTGAVQDFIDEVRPTDESDWLTLARASITITREQVEDYLAAATADGPLVPDATSPNPEAR
jgi:hypothetical protein